MNEKNVVSSNECVAVGLLQLALCAVLLRLLQRDVHETVEARQHAAIDDAAMQFDEHRASEHGLKEVGGSSLRHD